MAGKTLKSDIDFICPFCKGKVSAGMQPEPFTLHSVPECEKFISLEIDEFLKACRLKMAGAN